MAGGELYAFAWIGSALLSAVIGSSKNRNGCGWLAIGVVAGPLGLLASVLMPARPEPTSSESDTESASASEPGDGQGVEE